MEAQDKFFFVSSDMLCVKIYFCFNKNGFLSLFFLKNDHFYFNLFHNILSNNTLHEKQVKEILQSVFQKKHISFWTCEKCVISLKSRYLRWQIINTEKKLFFFKSK